MPIVPGWHPSRLAEIDKNLDSYAARRPTETAVVVLVPQAAGTLLIVATAASLTATAWFGSFFR